MPIYEYRGQHYSIDTADPAVAKQKILDHLAKTNPNDAMDQLVSSPWYKRAYEGNLGVGETLLQGLTAPVAAAYQGLEYGAQRALGADPYQAEQAGQEAAQRATYEPRSLGGQALAPIAGDIWNKTVESGGVGVSKLVSQDAPYFGATPEQAMKAGEAARSMYEGAVNFLGLTSPLHEIGVGIREGRAVKAANAAALEKANQKAMLDEAKRLQDQAQAEDLAKQQGYQEGMDNLDNTMLRYPQDYDAPQYGLGDSNLKSIPDQIGRDQTGITQESYDADMQQTAANAEQQYRNMDFQPTGMRTPQGQMADVMGMEATQPGAGPISYDRGIDYPATNEPTTLGEHLAAQKAAADAFQSERLKQLQEAQAWQERQNPQPGSIPADDVARNAMLDQIEEDLRRGNQSSVGPTDLSPGPAREPDPVALDEYRRTTAIYKQHERQIKTLSDELAKLEKINVDETDPEMEDRMSDLVNQIGDLRRAVKPARDAMLEARKKAYPDQSPGLSRTPMDEIFAGNAVKQNVLDRIGRTTTKGSIPARDLFNLIQKHTTNKFHQLVAGLLKRVVDPNTHVRIVDQNTFDLTKPGEDTSAFHSTKTGNIYTTLDHVGDISTMLHEGIHAAVTRFQKLRPNHPYSIAIRNLYKIVSDRAAQFGDQAGSYYYGLKNELEFVAEAMTNPRFQNLLKDIILSPDEARSLRALASEGRQGLLGTAKNAWHYLVEGARRILGAKPDMHDALSHAIDLTSNLAEDIQNWAGKDELNEQASRMNTSVNYDALHAAPIDDFKEQLKKAGLSKLTDKQIQQIWDNHNKVKPQTPVQANRTVTNKIDGLKRMERDLLTNKTLEEMGDEIKQAGDVGRYERYVSDKTLPPSFTMKDHPLYAWAMSTVHRVKNWATLRSNMLLSGANPKDPAPGSYNYIWKRLSRGERAEVNDLGQALNNSSVQLTDKQIQDKFLELHGKMMTPDQLQSYKDRIKINQQVLGDLNKFLKDEGKPIIGQLPHYWSPAEFKGPWLTIITDGAGKKHVVSSYFEPDVEKIKANLPGYDVRAVQKGMRSDIDMDQFQMIMRMLSNPMRADGLAAVQEGLRRSGFMRHGVKREGATGALGTEGGQKGLKNYEEVSERYIRQAYEYLSNRELDKVYNKLNDFDAPPRAKSMALDMIDTARGGSNRAFQAASEGISRGVSYMSDVATGGKATLPQNFLRDLVRVSNRVKTSLLIGAGNLTYLAANLLQAPSFAPPKLLALAAEYGKQGILGSSLSTFNAMARATNTLMKWDSHPDVQMLNKIGALEPTFRYDWTNYADPKALGVRNIWDKASGMWINAWVEKNAVRRPAALMFLEMLRELGYKSENPMDEYMMAKQLTDQYMVSMKWYEKAHMFSRSGLLGNVISPLQSFSVTWLGMLREYTKLGLEGALEGNAAKALPLAAFMGISLYTGGLMGTVGIRDYDNLVKFLNNHFDTNWPTAEELVFKHAPEIARKIGVSPDAISYGGLSAASGSSIGTTFSAPSLNGSYAPGLQFLWSLGKAGITGLRSTGMFGPENIPNSVEKTNALKAILPRVWGWGAAEKAAQLNNAPLQNSKGTAAGPYTRNDKDWMWRYLGTYSIDEQKAKAQWYETQRMAGNRQQLLTKSMTRAAEVIINDDDLQNNLPPLFQQLTQHGYQAPEIYHSLASELQRKLVEADTRALGRMTSSRQQQIYLWIQQLEGAANAGYQQQRQ